MNVRTNRKLVLAAIVVCMLNFTSCKKYEDGPLLSLRSKTSRLVGEWEVVEISDMSQLFFGDEYNSPEVEFDGDMIIEFEDDGDFQFSMDGDLDVSYGSYSYTYTMDEKVKGDWDWGRDKESVELDFPRENAFGFEDTEFEILRLTNDELWAEDEDGIEWECEKM